ncbi:acyl-CoA desaturase [Crateriforma conspicua]|uniref:Fatty acid desaturase n=1 Tax=Crateriforma conspicua TaxID=2527996 RepID=A0A5C5Y2K3_9PLAN|nr:acyl-CoA desaturase [Crateriforma conspicua]QDV63875.1 Fatty acid desaturase [Crateriforma conspicua]TWT69238.1 Fatty acid desaturase [Crateriforma conspicua]
MSTVIDSPTRESDPTKADSPKSPSLDQHPNHGDAKTGDVAIPQMETDATGMAKPDHGKPTAQERRRRDNLSLYALGWLGLAHIGCLFAPMTFTWAGLFTLIGLHWLTGSLGICLGYHRLLTHTGMKTHNWVRYLFGGIGSLAGEGSPLDWVADHRKHHAHSDQEGDPHSPHDGGWWSHVFWLAFHTHDGDRKDYLNHWVPDLMRDRGMRILDKMFLPMNLALGAGLFGIGYAFGGLSLATSLFIWGFCLRLVLVLHATWLVNSASHIWGYKNYETADDSRNNWIVAIFAYGEGWHNNHHAYPRMAKHGHKWWEFDMTWMMIVLLKKLGLVWDVVDYKNAAEKRARAAAQADKAA